jgi:hypothetical protein
MSRSDQVAELIALRGIHAMALEALGTQLDSVATALGELDQARLDLLRRVDNEAYDRLHDIGAAIAEVSGDITAERAEIQRVIAILRRGTLNIGVVGRARMGKSRLLQSLTGLTSREIPDGSRGFCTGVPSLIQHTPTGTTRAEVFLHDSKSFVTDVIRPYYERLDFGPPPLSAAEFARTALPAAKDSQPWTEASYGHLRAYHQAFGEYGDLLSHASPIAIEADQIRRYVAQDDEEGKTRLHLFRAVRQVRILTRFRQADVTGIGVIDLPGLGDTNLGDAKTLLAALRNDVDVVLFVRMPAAHGDSVQDFDFDLYSLAENALPEIPMQLRSFLVINHHSGVGNDNLANAQDFRDKIRTSSIRVVDSFITDCSKPEEVGTVFGKVVDYLLGHMRELDEYLLAERRRRAAEIRQQVTRILADSGQLGGLAEPRDSWFRLFQGLFIPAYTNMSRELEKLVTKFDEEQDHADENFAAAVDAVLAKAKEDDAIPAPDEITNRISTEGGRVPAYGHLLNETRSHLSQHFLSLDTALNERVSEMLRQVAQILQEAGELAAVAQGDGREFLASLAERVPPRLLTGGRSEIRYGLEMLAGFELSYRGFIQHRIRPCLNGMHPDHPTYPLGSDADQVTALQIREILQVTYEEALYKCEMALRSIMAEANGALFAIVEEFRDRVLRSHGLYSDWEAFYQDVRVEIWPSQFAALAENSSYYRRWGESAARLTALLADDAWQLPLGGEARR